MVIVTIYDSFVVLINVIFNIKSYNFFQHYKRWSTKVLKVAGIKLNIIGSNNIKKGETFIFASNHSSLFDIPILFKGLSPELRIIYKKELEKIPIFGYQLRKSPFIAVERNDPRKSMQSLNEAVEQIKNNINILLFPEGTRSPDGKVAPFKRGAFLLASKSGKPIIPITVIGSSAIMPKGTFHFEPQDVTIVIHAPVYYPAQLTKQQEAELMENVRNTIITGFDLTKKDLLI